MLQPSGSGAPYWHAKLIKRQYRVTGQYSSTTNFTAVFISEFKMVKNELANVTVRLMICEMPGEPKNS